MKPRKLNNTQVEEIRVLAKTSIKRVDIARKYGISPQLVSTIARYGYDTRPFRDRRKAVDPDAHTWVTLAQTYNSKYPQEALTPTEAKSIHDLALKKIRVWLEKQNLTKEDLL
jgi:hypothetical protein